MKCENEKCGKEHDGNFGSGKFCNRQCANSRKHSEDTKQKQSKSMSKYVFENREEFLKNRSYAKISCGIKTKEEIDAIIEKTKETWRNKLLQADFSTLKFESLRHRVLLEQDKKCNNCGLSEWLGKPINLEIEHKDGNHHNNNRDNVEAICPNCHSFTKTWRGRNKKQLENKNKMSDEDIVRAYLQTGNIRRCLLSLGLAAKGGNYGRVKKCLTLNGIKYDKLEILPYKKIKKIKTIVETSLQLNLF